MPDTLHRFDAPDGTGLAYRDAGTGLPLLCLSGLTRNSTDFDHVAPHLADVRMIRLDYRGRGASDRADPASYTVAVEARDALALLDHLGLGRAAVLGTSRGGLIAMHLAAIARTRLIGVCLNDIGPVLDPAGLDLIRAYVGKAPVVRSYAEAAKVRARMMTGFENVPHSRWLAEVRRHFVETDEGLALAYDPALARIFEDPPAATAPGEDGDAPDPWAAFDALEGLPLAALRGANSDLLSPETFAEMRRRRPDMIAAEVPGRGHVPFLDEPESLAVLHAWLDECR